MKHDVLELTLRAAGNVQTIHIKRGSLEVEDGCISYVQFDDHEDEARIYIPLHALDRFRYYNHSRSTP